MIFTEAYVKNKNKKKRNFVRKKNLFRNVKISKAKIRSISFK